MVVFARERHVSRVLLMLPLDEVFTDVHLFRSSGFRVCWWYTFPTPLFRVSWIQVTCEFVFLFCYLFDTSTPSLLYTCGDYVLVIFTIVNVCFLSRHV